MILDESLPKVLYESMLPVSIVYLSSAYIYLFHFVFFLLLTNSLLLLF